MASFLAASLAARSRASTDRAERFAAIVSAHVRPSTGTSERKVVWRYHLNIASGRDLGVIFLAILRISSLCRRIHSTNCMDSRSVTRAHGWFKWYKKSKV